MPVRVRCSCASPGATSGRAASRIAQTRGLPLLRHRFRRHRRAGRRQVRRRRHAGGCGAGIGAWTPSGASSCLPGANRCSRSTMRWSMRSMRAVSASRSRATAPYPRIPGSTGCASAPKRGARSSSARATSSSWSGRRRAPISTRWKHGTSRHFLVQPMDSAEAEANTRAAVALAMERPRWRLSLQTHKLLGLR
jgi:hypothetical protein